METVTTWRRLGAIWARGTVVLTAALLLAACAGTGSDSFGDPKGYVPATAANDVDWNGAETVTVTVTEYAFDPSNLYLAAGVPYRLHIENQGKVVHYFASDGFFKAIMVDQLSGRGEPVDHPYLKAIAVAPGESRELTFVPVRAGDFDLICTAPFHRTLGMMGKIAIR